MIGIRINLMDFGLRLIGGRVERSRNILRKRVNNKKLKLTIFQRLYGRVTSFSIKF